jgi:LexA-binding, inner membrane-associated putative hydrolase
VRIPSHFLITATLNRVAGKRLHTVTSAVLIGSVAPDVPLVVLSVSTAFFKLVREGRPITNIHSFMFDDLFFTNPVWIIGHGTLHAPLLLGAALLVTSLLRKQTWANWLWWFFIACAFHTLLDIPTHSSDGPLLLFPLNWTFRFQSPISYWEETKYGRTFTYLEYALDIFLLCYLFLAWFFRERRVPNK